MTQPMVVEDPDHGVGLKQMKEMPTLSAEEIPPTTFHSFPNLATELRLKIWKAACFPYAATKRGLHYINLESIGGNEISGELITQMTAMEMKALHPDFQTSSNLQGVVGRANRSAYMWDAGLWKACRESREFISRHFKLNIWGYIQEKDLDLLDLDECLSKACQLYPWKPRYEELEERPGLESSARKPEPFLPASFLATKSMQSALWSCQTETYFASRVSTGDLPVTMQAPRLHVPCPNSQEIVLLHSFNLVLEFNTSWLDDLPESWNKLKEEESSRGLFATWAEGCMRGRGNAPCIYLLNKAARWGPHWWVKDDMTSLS